MNLKKSIKNFKEEYEIDIFDCIKLIAFLCCAVYSIYLSYKLFN